MHGRTAEGTQMLSSHLHEIANRKRLPSPQSVFDAVRRCTQVLYREEPSYRPLDRRAKPGGLVNLGECEYFVILPDLHARVDFFHAALNWEASPGRTILRDLEDKRVQLICVGDAFHSESRGRRRWQKAFEEYVKGYNRHRHMDAEMAENLGLLEMICTVKSAYPENFHFIKGNHENIANERKEGNYPFMKFVYEGEMVREWILRFYGQEVFEAIYDWEKALPLMCRGSDFLVTHCEPERTLGEDEIINAYLTEDVIYSLTWVDNGQAEDGSAIGTLGNLLGVVGQSRIFGGHRPVSGRYSLRQGGRYVQINTPNNWVLARFRNMDEFDPRRDIIEITPGVGSERGGRAHG